jgi:hypothetical protein
LKGAGHNFGIVTAAKVNAFPQINNGIHWESTIVFLPDHIEEATQTINDLEWEKECQSTTLSPAFHHLDSYVIPFYTWPLVHVIKAPALTHMTLQPAVVLELWYAGTPSDTQKAFAPLFSLKPIYQDSSPTPYNEINAVLDRGPIQRRREADVLRRSGETRPCGRAGTLETLSGVSPTSSIRQGLGRHVRMLRLWKSPPGTG